MAGALILAGNTHSQLAADISRYAGVRLGACTIRAFPDGEISIQIKEEVRSKQVFVVQSIAHKPHDDLFELLLILDALKRASAGHVTAVIPYFGYARGDRRDGSCSPIAAKLMADLLTTAGASSVMTLDLHAGQIEGFFNIPVDNLYARPLLANAIAKQGCKNCVVVAPDLGAIKLAHAYAKELKTDFAVMDKLRHDPKNVEIAAIIGDVAGKDVVIVDDLCATGQTLIQAALAAKSAGAKKIIAACSHGLFVQDAVAALQNSLIEKILTTDSVPPKKLPFEVISIAPLFAKAIQTTLLG